MYKVNNKVLLVLKKPKTNLLYWFINFQKDFITSNAKMEKIWNMSLVYSAPPKLLLLLFFFSLRDSYKEAGDDIVSENSVDQPCAIIMNKPTGDVFSVLHVFFEVPLPAPGTAHNYFIKPPNLHKNIFPKYLP